HHGGVLAGVRRRDIRDHSTLSNATVDLRAIEIDDKLASGNCTGENAGEGEGKKSTARPCHTFSLQSEAHHGACAATVRCVDRCGGDGHPGLLGCRGNERRLGFLILVMGEEQNGARYTERDRDTEHHVSDEGIVLAGVCTRGGRSLVEVRLV